MKRYGAEVLPCGMLGLMLLCSGCGINRASWDPNSYSQPNPYTYWNFKNPPRDCEAIAPPPQQELPFSLGELVDIALKSSPQTKNSWAQAKLAAAQYGESQANLYPQLTGQANFNRIRSITVIGPFNTNPAQTVPYYMNIWGPQVNLSYLIFDFGTVRASSEAARMALHFANWTQNQAIQTLVQTITSDYYNYAYQRQLEDSLVLDLETASITLDAAKVGLMSGVKDVSDVLQAETQYLQTNLQLISQRQQVVNALAQLLADAGLPANVKLETNKLPIVDPSIDTLQDIDALIEVALTHRADLNASRSQLEAAEWALKAAKRNMLPKLNYTFNLGKRYFSGGVNDGYDFNSGFALTFPLFQGFSYINMIREARAQKELAEAGLQQMELQVIQQIVSAHQGVKTAHDSVLSAGDYLKAAAEQYKVALSQYKAGTASILTVVTAQSSLANARATDAQARSYWFTALSNLAYTTGLITDPAIANQEAP